MVIPPPLTMARLRRQKARRPLRVEELEIPGRTRLELLLVGPRTRMAYGRLLLLLASWILGLSPSPLESDSRLGWGQAIATVIDLGNDPESLDDMVAGFLDASFWAGEHSSLGPRLTSALG